MADEESLENSPSLFLGKSWSEWASKVEDEDELKRSKHGSGHAESLKLKRDDMPLFGLCPAQDEFYLVVCETCKQVVKPQALLRHMEVRHGKRSPRRRKTSSTSSTNLSPTLRSPARLTSPTRDERRAHSGIRSARHDAHGKTPPDEGGGGGGGSKRGLELLKSPGTKLHALSNAVLSSLSTDKQLQNHTMPVVKMERLPPTMSAKNNAPTLHIPSHSSSNHKPAHSSATAINGSKSSRSSSRDKSRGLSSSSSHLSYDLTAYSSKQEKLETNDTAELADKLPESSKSSVDKSDVSRLTDDDEDGYSLSALQAKLKSESSSQLSKADATLDSNSKSLNDIDGRHDVLSSASSSDTSSPLRKSHSSQHGSRHSSSEGTRSGKHKHHSHNHSDRDRGSKHREHADSLNSKHRQDKLAWTSSRSSPDTGSRPRDNSGKMTKANDKHDVLSSKDKHMFTNKGSDSGKENMKMGSVNRENNSGGLTDEQWNLAKLAGRTNGSDVLSSNNLLQLDEVKGKEIDTGVSKLNSVPVVSTSSSTKTDTHAKLTDVNSAKSHKTGSVDKTEHSQKSNKPTTLNFSLLTSPPLTSPSLTSPVTPSLTSPESTPTSASVGTKHLDKIDINSPTSTFGKKLAALQNPGKLLPCKDREYNPDIHCGVVGKEDNNPCTRSLTCKTHSLSLRRAVAGRCKPFDELLLEHRAAKEAHLLIKHGDGNQPASKAPKSSSSHKPSSMSSLSKTKIPSVSSKGHSMNLLTSRVTASTSSSMRTHRFPQSTLTHHHHPSHRMLPPPTQLPPKPPQIAEIPSLGPIPVPDIFTPPGLSDIEDEEDIRDRYDYPILFHHPRPAVVNTFGCRNAGSGCYLFNRRTDQLRAVFKLAVDRRLHPPPNKRLCLDSKLSANSCLSTSSSTSDPYEFGTGSPSLAAAAAKSKSQPKSPATATSSKSPAISSSSSSTSSKSQHKAKEDQVGGINYSVLFEGGSYMDPAVSPSVLAQQADVFTTGQPTITTAAGLISQRSTPATSDLGSNSAGPAAKRKRSTGSSPRPAVPTNTSAATIGGFAHNNNASNAISIAIPTGSLNLNLSSTTLNSLNATIAGNKISQLAAGKKDVNLVVTGGTSTVLNGQLLTSLPSTHLDSEGTGTQIRVKNSLSLPAAAPQKSKSRKRASSRPLSGMNAAVTSVNAVSMDTVAIVSNSGFGAVTSPSPAMTPSPLFQTGTAGSMPNGIIGQQGVKGVTSLNHVGCDVAMLTRDGSDASESLEQRHQPTPSKHKKQSHKHQKALQLQQHGNQMASAPASFSASQRLHVPYSIHGNNSVTGAEGFSHIQIQSKDPGGGGGKTLTATGKLAMKPMSLTIPLVGPGGALPDGLTVMQGSGGGGGGGAVAAGQRALLLPTPPDSHPGAAGDRAAAMHPPHHHRPAVHHAHHDSIPQLTLQNSPSSLIS